MIYPLSQDRPKMDSLARWIVSFAYIFFFKVKWWSSSFLDPVTVRFIFFLILTMYSMVKLSIQFVAEQPVIQEMLEAVNNNGKWLICI